MCLLSVANDCVVKDYVNSENLYPQKIKTDLWSHKKILSHCLLHSKYMYIYIYFLLNATSVSD